MNNGMTKVADDAKLFIAGLRTRARAECEDWQKDLMRLSDWRIKWQVKFSVDKLKQCTEEKTLILRMKRWPFS